MPTTFLKIMTIPVTTQEPDFDFALEQLSVVIYDFLCRSKVSAKNCKEISELSARGEVSYPQSTLAEEISCA